MCVWGSPVGRDDLPLDSFSNINWERRHQPLLLLLSSCLGRFFSPGTLHFASLLKAEQPLQQNSGNLFSLSLSHSSYNLSPSSKYEVTIWGLKNVIISPFRQYHFESSILPRLGPLEANVTTCPTVRWGHLDPKKGGHVCSSTIFPGVWGMGSLCHLAQNTVPFCTASNHIVLLQFCYQQDKIS